MMLVQPLEYTPVELFEKEENLEEFKIQSIQRGGVVVDREIAHQVKEMFDLSSKYNVKLF